ncbi:MAG: TrmO family methyltransferase [Gordonibacter sp.]|uniref:TrmO family methyltransferase domain-containing protein n=1 Tax=Gordonibacter sp. TaxID=1968902 RepID=UPI002FCA4DFC
MGNEACLLHPIGIVEGGGEGPAVLRLDPDYREGLVGVEDFGHLVVCWWGHKADTPDLRAVVDAGRPYRKLDHDLGIFATRSSLRPNPLCLTVVSVLSVDVEEGTVSVPYIDAMDGTPLMDLKPYTPSIDRLENPVVPAWCAHWPKSVEVSGDFDWEAEFLF